MGGFTRGQREQLDDFLKGARTRQQTQGKKRKLVQSLVAGLRQAAMDAVPWRGTVPLTKLEKAVHRHYQELGHEYRSLLTDELARRGFPGKESGEATLLAYCIAELKRSGREVSQVSETARQFVKDILNEGGLSGRESVYELVVEKLDTGSWQEAGLLKLLGYKVGNSGLGVPQRRVILRDAYRVSLVPGTEEVAAYLSSWGSPLSEQRLDKITGSISRFMALARNQRADYSAALADWQADLDWLRRGAGRR